MENSPRPPRLPGSHHEAQWLDVPPALPSSHQPQWSEEPPTLPPLHALSKGREERVPQPPHKERKSFWKKYGVPLVLTSLLAVQAGATALQWLNQNRPGWNPFGGNHTESSQGMNTNEFYALNPNNPDNPNDPQYLVESQPTVSLNGFLAVLHEHHSPMSDATARSIYALMLQKHINPAYFLAVEQQETGLATNDVTYTDDQGKKIDSLNICNMRPWDGIDLSVLKIVHTEDSGDFVDFSGFGNVPTPQNGGHDGYWHAADAWSNAITYWVSQGDVTVSAMDNRMTPSNDPYGGNNTAQYTVNVNQSMRDFWQISQDIKEGKRAVDGSYVVTAVRGDLPIQDFGKPNSGSV